jgi:hypothetical protein
MKKKLYLVLMLFQNYIIDAMLYDNDKEFIYYGFKNFKDKVKDKRNKSYIKINDLKNYFDDEEFMTIKIDEKMFNDLIKKGADDFIDWPLEEFFQSANMVEYQI